MPNTRIRNERGRFVSSNPVNVTKPSQVKDLKALIRGGPVTFILIYADWCGHCQRYKPTWQNFENTPGRTANIASVRDDMVKHVDTIKNAKIQGYPSVIKVQPSGEIEEFKVPGSPEVTNAIPIMRDEEKMKAELTNPSPNNERENSTIQLQPGLHSLRDDVSKNQMLVQSGGGLSIAGAFISAIQAAGPAALLLAAHSLLPKRRFTYKSPKRSSRRASTRRARRG